MKDLVGLPHLLLNGGQTLPNVLPMLELGARGYVVLFTRDQPVDALRRASASFGMPELLAIEVPAFDVEGVVKRLGRSSVKLEAALGGDELVVNLTGGARSRWCSGRSGACRRNSCRGACTSIVTLSFACLRRALRPFG